MKNENGKPAHAFIWLNTTQFLGALNDNIFKLLVILFLIGVRGSVSAANVSAFANAVFVVPFLLFLALAGRLADRHSKRDIIIYCKAAELAVMMMAVAAFYIGSQVLLYIVFFCMAAQSTFFSPCKYGIIRELVPDEKVSRANGWLEAATFVAIILGTASAPKFPALVSDNYAAASLICVFIAAVGLVTSVKIRKTESAGGTNRASLIFLQDVWRTIWSIHRKKNLLWSVIGSAYFWLIGAIIYMVIIPYGMEMLSLTKDNSTYLIVPAAFGIAFGALAAGKLSSIGLVPIGVVGLGIFCLALGLINPSLLWVCVLIFLMGFSAGVYIVPVNTLIQLRSPKYRRSEIIAASSFLGWLAMLVASGVILLCNNIFKINIRSILLLLGVFILLTATIVTIYLAEFLLRFLSSVLVRLVYHPKVTGVDNVPARGGVLLICNHVSYADAPLLAAACPRPVRFVMDRDFYNIPWLKPICKLGRTIPILAKDPPKKIAASIRQARNALKAGDVICVFAEGYMTRNGNMLSFKAGFEKMVRGTRAAVIPAYIGGMWGSILSYYHGRPFSTGPGKFANPVSIHFGSALPDGASAEQVKLQVQLLSCDYFNNLKSPKRSLAYRFIRAARRNRRRHCISDSSGKKLNYSQTLIASLALADKIKAHAINCDRIGILLPPSVGAVLANVAVALLGKVPVNLNYTLSLQVVNSAITECNIRCVISSRKFLERFPELKTIPNLIFLKDISRTINFSDKFKALLKSRFFPARLLAGIGHHNCDDVAAIIFSSGSGGKPKGVMLSHHNIISNIDSMCSIFKLKPGDNLCAVLPFFHSFGFTCSLWLPVINGVSASFVPNPLDAKTVGRTARLNHSTVLFAAPTFINSYLKRVEVADFSKLRLVMAGAEELKTNIADAFEEKFGIRPREGYGATELSPVVAFNVADLEVDGLVQVGTKDGTVGHPIPGIAAKVVDPDTKETITDGRESLLMIKGPNVMLGYLNDEEKSCQVIRDGWYCTGDIAAIDSDGFIKITGRLARFSKIGGEMVPHVAIENLCHRFFNAESTMVAVTSVPDAKKGEELIVLYKADICDPGRLHEIISKSDLPNLYKPKKENYYPVDEIPILGSGKLDLVRIKKIAQALKNQD
jgi:acyl-[acyl-carrier-protein]-phospholipid O-acyltransferase/long-chain-fatty-acid--[acyl-carrier-protein] ligase